MSCIVITNDASELRSTLKYLHPYVLLYKINTDEYEVVLDDTDTYDKEEVINWDAIDSLDLHLKGRDEQEEERVAPPEEQWGHVQQNPIGEGLRQREANVNIHWEVVDDVVPEENN